MLVLSPASAGSGPGVAAVPLAVSLSASGSRSMSVIIRLPIAADDRAGCVQLDDRAHRGRSRYRPHARARRRRACSTGKATAVAVHALAVEAAACGQEQPRARHPACLLSVRSSRAASSAPSFALFQRRAAGGRCWRLVRRLCDSPAQASPTTRAVVPSPGRTRLDLGEGDRPVCCSARPNRTIAPSPLR